MSFLEVRDLEVDIGSVPVLRGIDLSLERGGILGLVGESGSGKSMTALSIMRLLPEGGRMRGRIVLDGEDLTASSEARMCTRRGRDIGLVFQEPMTALDPLQTIGAQVAETVRTHRRTGRREALDEARRALDRVGLPAAEFPLGRYPHELSGGQRQRVVIAMAVVLRPKLLIADEPTTALDVTTQAAILAMLRRLVTEDGSSLVLITHDLAVVADMADRIAVMHQGRIVETAETTNLFKGLTHPYAQALVAASSHAPARKEAAADLAATPLLRVENLSRHYALPGRTPFAAARTLRAVDDVSFTVRAGENVGLVGESGSGKSTLARLVLALDAPNAGRVLVDGADFHAARGAERLALRRKVQMVFQDPYGSFDPRYRVGRLVAEPFHLDPARPSAAERRDRVAEMLAAVGLSPPDADRYPHEFSGGQRQRLAIARALITRPALIVLDEAVSALDVTIRAQVLDLLADLGRRFAVSYLFISHDLAVVRAITDRVLIMRRGRIVEEGMTAEIFARPRHDYTVQLIDATPNLERALAARRDRMDAGG